MMAVWYCAHATSLSRKSDPAYNAEPIVEMRMPLTKVLFQYLRLTFGMLEQAEKRLNTFWTSTWRVPRLSLCGLSFEVVSLVLVAAARLLGY